MYRLRHTHNDDVLHRGEVALRFAAFVPARKSPRAAKARATVKAKAAAAAAADGDGSSAGDKGNDEPPAKKARTRAPRSATQLAASASGCGVELARVPFPRKGQAGVQEHRTFRCVIDAGRKW